MASIFGKILKKQSPARIFTTFNSSLPIQPLLNHLSETNPPPFQPPIDPIPFSDPQKLDSYSNPSKSLQFYPTFSFGFFLNPVPSTGFLQFDGGDENGVVSGDSPTIWADSVKKKRKKKMNKHKLRKLRKRLRRKTKT